MNVDVSLQDRGSKEQRVILRTSLPGLPPLVAVAENPDITRALCDAKRELIRQIERQKSAREPMNNRRQQCDDPASRRLRAVRDRRTRNSRCSFETQPTARLRGQIERQT